MKIALVRARYNPFGGAERFAARAMQALASQKVTVTIIARSWKAQGAGSLRFLRCDPFYLGSTWRDWSFARAVRRLVENEHFDLVQSHERIPGLAIYRAGDGVHAAWLARRSTQAGFWKRCAIQLNLHHRYLLRVERTLFEHPDLRAVICNSTLVRDEIATRFRIEAQKLVLIRNGVDLDYFAPAACDAHRETIRNTLAIPLGAMVFVFVGSGFERKGLASALNALAYLPANCHLIVVGGDKRQNHYEALARAQGILGRTHFVGEVTNPLPYYAAADTFVLPSIYDPFPNAVLEALACGVPVITSDGCGAKDVISENENGWIIESGDIAALAACMQRVSQDMCNVTKAQALRQAARSSVEGYGTEALGQALLDLYARLGVA